MPWFVFSQPPSGGCVLKLHGAFMTDDEVGRQPPSGGCVLKPAPFVGVVSLLVQPPSGGCVLKLPAPF